MASQARISYVRVPPRKARWVADLIRGKSANDATAILKFTKKKSASVMGKLLKSAVSNASHDGRVNPDRLFIKTITVDGGPVIKRFMSRAQGRATPKHVRTSHITVVLGEK